MNITRQIDLGTEASRCENTVSIEIDGKPINVQADISVMRAAREIGVDVPKLRATDSQKSYGSCRLRVVEIAVS